MKWYRSLVSTEHYTFQGKLWEQENEKKKAYIKN